jgi:cysteine synthase A
VANVPSRIEGIWRPKIDRSFHPDRIDELITVTGVAGIATMKWPEARVGRKTGPSTDKNL